MERPSAHVIGLALIGLLTVTMPLVPIHACADNDATDRHEIPTFVLQRTELAPDTANAASPATR